MRTSQLVEFAGRYGAYSLARLLTAKRPRMLMYHRFSTKPKRGYVDAETFEWQVNHLVRHYSLVTVTDLAAGLFEGKPLPPKSLALTVDDGYRDFYDIAWPILKKYGVPATFFVTTGFVSGDVWLWPDQLRYLLERAPEVEEAFDFVLFQVTTPIAPEAFESEYWRLNQLMLRADNSTKLACLEGMASEWEVSIPNLPPEEFASVSWAQLAEMQAEGLEVGGHTNSHPSLARINLREAEDEIIGCAHKLNAHLGESYRSFCYPNGTPDDFVGDHVKFIQKAGFSCATVAFADSSEHQQRFAMRRHAVSADRFQFLKATSGIELLGMKWRGTFRETPYG